MKTQLQQLSNKFNLNKRLVQSRRRRKKSRRKLERVIENCKSSLIEELCKQEIIFLPNVGNIMNNQILEQTIDLCEENSNDNLNSSKNLPSTSLAVSKDLKIVIDLSKDKVDQTEVIDLTDCSTKSPNKCKETKNIEATVIDLIDDDIKEDNTTPKSETNDEILVIGTFSKAPSLNSSKNNAKYGHSSQGGQSLEFIPLSYKPKRLSNSINLSEKVKQKYLKRKLNSRKFSELKSCDNLKVMKNTDSELFIDNLLPKSKLSKVGENIYTNSPLSLPKNGLRPVIIDGSNVAYTNLNIHRFSCKRLDICIKYFKEKGHKVTAFVPQYRMQSHKNDDPNLLNSLVKSGDVILTPSKVVDGKCIVPYDDRFIVQTAVLKGGVIVSRDNYNDLLKENHTWSETIKYRTLPYTWVDDVLMFPSDPLGEHGPTLEEFLRFN